MSVECSNLFTKSSQANFLKVYFKSFFLCFPTCMREVFLSLARLASISIPHQHGPHSIHPASHCSRSHSSSGAHLTVPSLCWFLLLLKKCSDLSYPVIPFSIPCSPTLHPQGLLLSVSLDFTVCFRRVSCTPGPCMPTPLLIWLWTSLPCRHCPLDSQHDPFQIQMASSVSFS